MLRLPPGVDPGQLSRLTPRRGRPTLSVHRWICVQKDLHRPRRANTTEGVPMNEITARALLGVSPSADVDEIKRAFRRIARTAHPDHGGSAEAFQRLIDAQLIALAGRQQPPSTARRVPRRAWISGGDSATHRVSVVDCRRRRADFTEAASPDLSFGDVLARAVAAA